LIRKASLLDSLSISRLCSQLGYPIKEEQVKPRLERLINDKDNAVFVFETNEGYIVGWVHVFGKHLLELEYAEIGGLVVDSNFRRQGIGEKLMRKCEEWAKENGYQEIRLRSGGERRIGYQNIKWQQVFSRKL
jgi:ribosomal protein S18 acetylase RimI-like enzyme